MAKESEIRKRAIQILTDEGWVTWFAPKVKFHETDIFSIADLICCQKKRIRFIQLTTLPNVSSKRRKITTFLKKFKVELPIEIWGWDRKKREFRKEKVNLKRKK